MNQFESLKNKLNILSDEIDELHLLYEDDSYSEMPDQIRKVNLALADIDRHLNKILGLV